MNMFKYFVLVLFFTFTNFAFSQDNKLFESDSSKRSVSAAWLWHGFFDITNLRENYDYYDGVAIPHPKDSINGMYLFVEGGWDGPCCVSSYHLRLSIGKNMMSMQNDSVWVLVNSADRDSLNSELKKGNSLSMEKFKKLEFDSSHVQYVISSSVPSEIEINIQRDSAHSDYYILYQKGDLFAALCGIRSRICYYQIACFYQDGGALTFDSVPDPSKLVDSDHCLDNSGSYVQHMVRNLKKQNEWDKLYKVNGVPATRNSSNIVIRNNKQPKLQLKGKR